MSEYSVKIENKIVVITIKEIFPYFQNGVQN
jgi:hypothetical protein